MNEWVGDDRYHVGKPLTPAFCRLLAGKPKLKTIQFCDYKPANRTFELLNEHVFRKRKDISLRVYDWHEKWADIDFLENMPDLERFEWEASDFGSPEPLYCLKKLTSLDLGSGHSRPRLSLAFLSDFAPTLKSLTLHGTFGDVEAVSTLEKLQRAWFVSVGLDNFDFLAGLPLKQLGNYGSRVKDFGSVRALKSLTYLWIKYNVRITDLDFLPSLSNLNRLFIHAATKITRLPDMSGLRKLKEISLLDCKRLADISGAMKTKGCRIGAWGALLPGGPIHLKTPK